MSYENTDKHLRTQIRRAVAKALYGLPTTGERVFISRVYPLESTALPGIIIKTESDQADEEIAGWSRLQLIIKAYAKTTMGLDDVLDQIELEIRISLLKNKALAEIVKDINWLHTNIQLENRGEQPIGVAEIVFNIDYQVAENNL